MNLVDQLLYAKKVNNHEVYTASGTHWTSTTVYQPVVPAGKRWFVLGGVVDPDVSTTHTVVMRNAAGDTIGMLNTQAATANPITYPSTVSSTYTMVQSGIGGYILDAGESVLITFGTAQSTAAYCTCIVLEVDYL